MPALKLFIFACIILSLNLVGCQGRPEIPAFDSKIAYDLLKKQCEFGPRTPNSEAHEQCEKYLFDWLAETTAICRTQKFVYCDSAMGDTLRLTNIIASFNPKNKQRLLLAAHWDCRPWADQEADSTLHNKPILGANDGASGVAILLTIARLLQQNSPPIGIDIVLFDGEDYGSDKFPERWLLGSKYFVKNLGGYKPIGVILLDMVGDSDLRIYRENYSQINARWLNDLFWKAAEIEKASHFSPEVKHTILDDHIPFLQAGIPAIDIIDMDYQYWHTLKDTPDKCSPGSLEEVGRVVLRIIYDKELKLAGK
jgi:glutaminyl-peptide cyclotransferase